MKNQISWVMLNTIKADTFSQPDLTDLDFDRVCGLKEEVIYYDQHFHIYIQLVIRLIKLSLMASYELCVRFLKRLELNLQRLEN